MLGERKTTKRNGARHPAVDDLGKGGCGEAEGNAWVNAPLNSTSGGLPYPKKKKLRRLRLGWDPRPGTRDGGGERKGRSFGKALRIRIVIPIFKKPDDLSPAPTKKTCPPPLGGGTDVRRGRGRKKIRIGVAKGTAAYNDKFEKGKKEEVAWRDKSCGLKKKATKEKGGGGGKEAHPLKGQACEV